MVMMAARGGGAMVTKGNTQCYREGEIFIFV